MLTKEQVNSLSPGDRVLDNILGTWIYVTVERCVPSSESEGHSRITLCAYRGLEESGTIYELTAWQAMKFLYLPPSTALMQKAKLATQSRRLMSPDVPHDE